MNIDTKQPHIKIAKKKTESLKGDSVSPATNPYDMQEEIERERQREGGQLLQFHRINSQNDFTGPQLQKKLDLNMDDEQADSSQEALISELHIGQSYQNQSILHPHVKNMNKYFNNDSSDISTVHGTGSTNPVCHPTSHSVKMINKSSNNDYNLLDKKKNKRESDSSDHHSIDHDNVSITEKDDADDMQSNTYGFGFNSSQKESESAMGISVFSNADQKNTNQKNDHINEINAPEEATDIEKSIHMFLDSLQVFQINVERFLDNESRIESPDVKCAIDEQKSKLSSVFGDDYSKNSRTPSFLLRRQRRAQNDNKKNNRLSGGLSLKMQNCCGALTSQSGSVVNETMNKLGCNSSRQIENISNRATYSKCLEITTTAANDSTINESQQRLLNLKKTMNNKNQEASFNQISPETFGDSNYCRSETQFTPEMKKDITIEQLNTPIQQMRDIQVEQLCQSKSIQSAKNMEEFSLHPTIIEVKGASPVKSPDLYRECSQFEPNAMHKAKSDPTQLQDNRQDTIQSRRPAGLSIGLSSGSGSLAALGLRKPIEDTQPPQLKIAKQDSSSQNTRTSNRESGDSKLQHQISNKSGPWEESFSTSIGCISNNVDTGSRPDSFNQDEQQFNPSHRQKSTSLSLQRAPTQLLQTALQMQKYKENKIDQNLLNNLTASLKDDSSAQQRVGSNLNESEIQKLSKSKNGNHISEEDEESEAVRRISKDSKESQNSQYLNPDTPYLNSQQAIRKNSSVSSLEGK